MSVSAPPDTSVKSTSGVSKTPTSTAIVPDSPSQDTSAESRPECIHRKLRRLREQEVYRLGRNPSSRRSAKAADHYFYRVFLEIGRYLRYVFWTWWGLAVTTAFGGLGPFDWFTMFVYAFGGTVFLFVVLVGCLILNSPPFKHIYHEWANENAGGLGLVNNANPRLFKALLPIQANAAKKFLEMDFDPKNNTETKREFNLDAAKLFLQFAAIVYEHPNEAVRNALLIAAGAQGNKDIDLDVDNLDTLATLQQKTFGKFQDALRAYDSGEIGDGVIHGFCRKFSIEFEPLSELGNTSSAFAALFWDKKSNWIVLTFKGTHPIEFGEWLSDLDTKLSHVGSHIPSFRKVHYGFKERVFPADCSKYGGSRPYDTILNGVKTLAEWLYKYNGLEGKRKINLWVTGHSLGCATASLVYSRFLMKEKDLGQFIVLRDAYLFAAPIVSDRESVEAFNAKMMEDPDKPKTMWRVTSNGDFVATCLPELGDYDSISVSPTNAFAFAHLGTELKLQSGSSRARATGNHLAYGTRIRIKSEFDQDQIEEQRALHSSRGGIQEWSRQERGRWYQKIPLIGRLVAHGTVFYWDQLDSLDVGKLAIWAWN